MALLTHMALALTIFSQSLTIFELIDINIIIDMNIKSKGNHKDKNKISVLQVT